MDKETEVESLPLIKIDKMHLKKIKPAILFPISSKVFNQNFSQTLPENLEFYFQEDKESEDVYLLPGEPPEEEADTHMVEPIRLNRINTNKHRGNLRNKTIHFNDEVQCLTLTKGKWSLKNIPLNDKQTRITETFFGCNDNVNPEM